MYSAAILSLAHRITSSRRAFIGFMAAILISPALLLAF
jgi:hypothetical protein